ncbi:MAG TPA: PHP domain-containing protein [Methanocella sp.]|nr:PHP domain-containing protein [Methanocella sp.]
MKVDLHVHSNKSDGRNSVRELIEAAELGGLDVLAITDHGPGHGSGITERQARETKAEVAALQPSYRVKVLVGIEAEVLPTGEVFLADRDGLDLVLASYHAAPSEEAYYRAVFRAMEDPRVDVLAHHAWSAGARFSPVREHEERLVALLRDHGKAIEINSKHCLPSWDFLAMCRDAGVKYTIGSDAHRLPDVGSVAWASNAARHIFKDQGLFLP